MSSCQKQRLKSQSVGTLNSSDHRIKVRTEESRKDTGVLRTLQKKEWTWTCVGFIEQAHRSQRLL